MSWQMKALAAYLRLTRKRRNASTAAAERALAEPKSSSMPPVHLARRFTVTTNTIDGFDVHVVSPDGSDHSATAIYLHGGAYVGEIQRLHWSFIAEVASGVGIDVWVPIYGLAPQYHAEDAIRLMHNVLRDASPVGPVYMMGDSAGGGLALAATLSWIQADGQSPIGLTLIAPWLDIGMSNPGIAAIEPRDPWLSSVGLHAFARAWADGMSLDDPRVSPIFGDLTAVPPIDLYVGDRDITLADCSLLRDSAPPGRVIYHEEPGAVHAYPLLPVPEGRAARKDVVANVKTALAKV